MNRLVTIYTDEVPKGFDINIEAADRNDASRKAWDLYPNAKELVVWSPVWVKKE